MTGSYQAEWHDPLIPDSHPHRVTSTKCRINTVVSPDDGHIVARNMKRFINIQRNKNVKNKFVLYVGFIHKNIQG